MPKKKGGKMGNMTDEERLMLLEQQRLAEEEMQKNKEDMLAQFLKVSTLQITQIFEIVFFRIFMTEGFPSLMF